MIAHRARQIYPLIFSCQKEDDVPIFFDYLVNDIRSLMNRHDKTSQSLFDIRLMQLSPHEAYSSFLVSDDSADS